MKFFCIDSLLKINNDYKFLEKQTMIIRTKNTFLSISNNIHHNSSLTQLAIYIDDQID